ncbi:MAG: shikimate dehydrogenase [Bacteroidetes bacterium]|nr:shikimate dehydrogenase [Bacteroidota bacterium]
MNKVYGIIGFPLAHSFSQRYFSEKFVKEGWNNCSYKVFPLNAISEFESLIKSEPNLLGLSVTIPYKESVIPYLDELDASAKKVGAVNSIQIIRNGNATPKLIGFNTDVFGFSNALKPFLKNNHQRALILGTGGAAKAVAAVLKELGIDFYYVSRNGMIKDMPIKAPVFNYDELNENHFKACHLIVNSSPVGMSPNESQAPFIPYSYITPEHLLFDLIYNPNETIFLRKGKEQGALTQNGLTMLYLQAEESWKIWNKE